MLVYGECECFVMQMLYVCALCASCGSSQCCVLHDLQFDTAGRGCNMRPYRRGMLWMCVLYVSFGPKVRPRTFGCVVMDSALLLGQDCSYILQGLVLTECKLFCLDLVRGCFVLFMQKLYVGMVVCISWLHSYLCVWM